MLSIGEAHQVQLIYLSTSHRKGSMETQSTQEIKQLKKVTLQCESHVLKTTHLLNAAVFTVAPQNTMDQMKYYFLQIRSDQIWWKDNGDREKKQEGPEKESKTTLYLKKVWETGLQKQWIKTFN